MQTAGASTLTPPGQPTDANGNAMALKKVAQTIRAMASRWLNPSLPSPFNHHCTLMPNATFTEAIPRKVMRQAMHIWTRTGIARHKAIVIDLLILFAAMIGFAPAHAASVERIALVNGELTLQFDAPVGEAASFVLDGPRRLAIDIAGAEPGPQAEISDANVVRARQARSGGNVMRLVLDLAQPAVVSRASYSDDGRSITFALNPATAEDFLAAVRAGQQAIMSPIAGVPTLEFARRAVRRYQVSVPIGPARSGPDLPRIVGAANPNLPLVVIDAGHGGHDPGALSADRRHREADVTLAIARQVRDALVASGRVRVALTRDSDRFLVLEERYGLARRLGADLFISIHADAAENESATGASIYTLSEVASDREAARLAARENRANFLGDMNLGTQNSDVRSILIDLTQRETMNLSADFARTLQRTAAGDIPFRPGSHRFAGFVVLKAPDMPSVLLETGFITNSGDAARISSAEGQRAMAHGVREAVLLHFARQIAAHATGGDRMAAAASASAAP